MSRQVFLLPDLGEGLAEAELVNWLVGVGDGVVVDQSIAEVETAKSIVEVPCPYAGTVAVLHGAAGETMAVGKPLISVDAVGSSPPVDGPDDAGAASADAAFAPAHPAAEAYRQEERAGADVPETEPALDAAAATPDSAGSGNVLIGYGTPGGHGAARRTRARKSAPAVAARNPAVGSRTIHAGGSVLVVSPLVRKLAKESGVALAELDGSGQDGLIMRRDVLSAASAAAPGSAAAYPAATPTAAPNGSEVPPVAASSADVDAKTGLGIRERTPIKGLRKTVAANLVRSRTEIPEATVWVDVDATALVQMRAGLKAKDPQTAPGLLAFIARFALAGLAKYPQLNTRIENEAIVGFDGVNLGVAAQTDRGLMVPSVRRAEMMSARELDAEIRRLAVVARAGKATPAELTSGTFTLNNYGVFGVDGSAAIINYPEAAILGVGRIIDKPWVVDGELAVRKVTELTLTFDHRVCDGGTAGGFLRYVADAIENPGSVLADL